jgi:hypothetical protein
MSQQVDLVAAAKANLELMVAENAQLTQYFEGVMKKLTEIETLEPTEKRQRFRELENHGDLKFNGVDIRHYAHATPTRPLSPPQFLQRTRRRLRNTNTLIEEFLKRDIFKEGSQLRDDLDALTYNIVDAENQQEVLEFKGKVETLRNSPVFTQYMDIKRDYIKRDPEIRTEAEFISAKESTEENIENFQKRGDDLKAITAKMESGEMSANEVQLQLEELALIAPETPATEETL